MVSAWCNVGYHNNKQNEHKLLTNGTLTLSQLNEEFAFNLGHTLLLQDQEYLVALLAVPAHS